MIEGIVSFLVATYLLNFPRMLKNQNNSSFLFFLTFGAIVLTKNFVSLIVLVIILGSLFLLRKTTMPFGFRSRKPVLLLLGLGLLGYLAGRQVMDGNWEASSPTSKPPEKSFDLESDVNHASGLGASFTNPDRSISAGSKKETHSPSLSQQHQELLLEYRPPVKVEWHFQ